MKKSSRWWILSALLVLLAVGTAGFAAVTGMAMGAVLGAGGSDASGETWRMAQSDPALRRELERTKRAEARLVREQERRVERLFAAAGGLGLAGVLAGGAGWRARRRAA